MDQSFFLRAKLLLDQRQPRRLDHALLVRTVTARQGATPCAQAATRARGGAAPVQGNPLVAVLIGGPEPRQAAAAQGGCFNRVAAARLVNRS